jgi:SM-20-related protein
MAYLDIKKFEETARVSDPFEFIIVPAFLRQERLEDINADFPAIEQAGNFPIEDLTFGPRFGSFLDEIKGPQFREAIEQKFDVDLEGLKHVVTVRAHSQKSDGNIHTDAPSKVLTALIYLNQNWESDAGRLRLMRNERDFDDYIAEVPPVAGTLLCSSAATTPGTATSRSSAPGAPSRSTGCPTPPISTCSSIAPAR